MVLDKVQRPWHVSHICGMSHGSRGRTTCPRRPGTDLEMAMDRAGCAQAGLCWPPCCSGVWTKPWGGSCRMSGWWEGPGVLPRKCPVPAPYLRLRPHERESHTAFEEVRFQQFTGNAHFLLKDKKYQEMGWLHQDKCVEEPQGGKSRLQQIWSCYREVLRKQPLLAVLE